MAERNLNIVINAKNNATKELGNLSSALEKNKATIQKTTLAATAVFAGLTAAIGSSVKAYGAAGDQIQKMALRTGFSTTALSELKHVAEQSGTSIEKLEVAIMKSNRMLAQTDDEAVTAMRALERLGLSASDLDAMGMEDRFFAMANAVAKIEDPGRRAAMAMEVFGKSGTELLPMLASGADSIQAMREEAHKLGIVFDQEAADKAAKYTDSMDKMQKSMDGVKFALAEAFIPLIITATEKVTAAIVPIQQWIKENPDLARNILIVTAAVAGFIAVMGTITLLMMAFNPISLIVVGAIAGITLAIYAINNLLNIFGLTWSNVWEGIKQTTVRIIGAIITLVEGMINTVITGINGIIKAINRVISAISNIPGMSKFSGAQISTISKVDFGGADMLRTGSMGGNTVNVTVMGDVSGEQLIQTVSDRLMGNLGHNVKLTAF
jgi:hypothetical protein